MTEAQLEAIQKWRDNNQYFLQEMERSGLSLSMSFTDAKATDIEAGTDLTNLSLTVTYRG